jgi:hypothetical protein
MLFGVLDLAKEVDPFSRHNSGTSFNDSVVTVDESSRNIVTPGAIISTMEAFGKNGVALGEKTGQICQRQ